MQKTLNTLRIILSIENTVNINEILHTIRNIPLIGKYIPEKIYGLWIIKFFATVMSVISEVAKAFFGKLGLFVLLFFGSAILGSFEGKAQETAFLFGFVLISVIWMFVYNVFRNTPEGEYAVFHMGMDAKKYVTARFLYDSFNVILGYTVFGIPAAILSGVKWYLAILIPLAGIGFKVAPLGCEMSVYAFKQSLGRKKNRKGVPLSIDGNWMINALLITAISFAGLIGGGLIIYYELYLPVVIIYLLSVLSIVPGILLMRKFPFELYKTALYADKVRSELIKKQQKKETGQSFEVKINESEGSRHGSTGYKYLNELFFLRHRKIFLKNQIIFIAMTVIGIGLMGVFLYFEITRFDDVSKSVLRYLFTKHPGIFVFFLAAFNTGGFMSRAMFASCDSTMLVYGFYRTPEALRKMFRLRAFSIFKYNMIQSVMMMIFAIATILLTGGENYFGEIISVIVTITSFTALFSIRHLTVYYILQPYSKDFLIKSKLYGYLSFIYGTICFFVMFIPMTNLFAAIAGILIAGLYFFTADKIVYKFAHKTLRIK